MPNPAYYPAILRVIKDGETQEVALKNAVNGPELYTMMYHLAHLFQALNAMGKNPVEWLKERLGKPIAVEVESEEKRYAVNFETGDFEVITRPRGGKGGRTRKEKVTIEL